MRCTGTLQGTGDRRRKSRWHADKLRSSGVGTIDAECARVLHAYVPEWFCVPQGSRVSMPWARQHPAMEGLPVSAMGESDTRECSPHPTFFQLKEHPLHFNGRTGRTPFGPARALTSTVGPVGPHLAPYGAHRMRARAPAVVLNSSYLDWAVQDRLHPSQPGDRPDTGPCNPQARPDSKPWPMIPPSERPGGPRAAVAHFPAQQ